MRKSHDFTKKRARFSQILQKKKNVIDTVMGDISMDPDTDIMTELFNELHNHWNYHKS